LWPPFARDARRELGVPSLGATREADEFRSHFLPNRAEPSFTFRAFDHMMPAKGSQSLTHVCIVSNDTLFGKTKLARHRPLCNGCIINDKIRHFLPGSASFWLRGKRSYQGGGQYYSADAASSVCFVWATVQLGSPTLNLANLRTVMFSPSLATLLAIRSLMLCDCSLMKGCSRRQTSS
jgi:hypothetical protein